MYFFWNQSAKLGTISINEALIPRWWRISVGQLGQLKLRRSVTERADFIGRRLAHQNSERLAELALRTLSSKVGYQTVECGLGAESCKHGCGDLREGRTTIHVAGKIHAASHVQQQVHNSSHWLMLGHAGVQTSTALLFMFCSSTFVQVIQGCITNK